MAAAPTPPNGTGFSFILTWSVIEYALSGMLAAGTAVAMWVWHLGRRTDKLEDLVEFYQLKLGEMEDDLRDMKKRSEEDRKELTKKFDELREALPDRNFILHQLNNLSMRLDGVMDRKMTQITQVVRDAGGDGFTSR